jgi:hypothetical protein
LYTLLIGCQKDSINENEILDILTGSPSNISENFATIGSTIIAGKSIEISSRGVCFAKRANPTVKDIIVESGSGSGSYNVQLINLESNTIYFAKSYAVTPMGVYYGNEVSFKTKTYSIEIEVDVFNLSAFSFETQLSILNPDKIQIIQVGVCRSKESGGKIIDKDDCMVSEKGGLGFPELNFPFKFHIEYNTSYYITPYLITINQDTIVGSEKRINTLVPKVGDLGPRGGVLFFDKGNNSNGWRFIEAHPETYQSCQFANFCSDNPNITYISNSEQIGEGINNTNFILANFTNCNKNIIRDYRPRVNISEEPLWHLPTFKEMVALIEYSKNPINYEHILINRYYFTSTLWGGTPKLTYFAFINGGNITFIAFGPGYNFNYCSNYGGSGGIKFVRYI